jgi:SNF2 family DNA or RNA helicase
VVITTYATLLRDAAQAEAITWSLVIADEAQAIGNPDGQERSGGATAEDRRSVSR